MIARATQNANYDREQQTILPGVSHNADEITVEAVYTSSCSPAACGDRRWRRTTPRSRRPARPRPVVKRRKSSAALEEAWPDHPEWVDMLTVDPCRTNR